MGRPAPLAIVEGTAGAVHAFACSAISAREWTITVSRRRTAHVLQRLTYANRR